jgi:hypothetical protein
MADELLHSENHVAPNTDLKGCWAPGALIEGFQLRRNAMGCRLLVPIGPVAKEVREDVLLLLGTGAWSAVEAVVCDLLDTLAGSDVSLDEVCVETFRHLWINILEAKPRNADERNLVILREKIRMMTTLRCGRLLNSNFAPEIASAQQGTERLAKLTLEIAEAIRRQKAPMAEASLTAAATSSQTVNLALVAAPPSPGNAKSGKPRAAVASVRRASRNTLQASAVKAADQNGNKPPVPRWRPKGAGA